MSAVERGRVVGAQFHPELSGTLGLGILKVCGALEREKKKNRERDRETWKFKEVVTLMDVGFDHAFCTLLV